MYIAMQVPLTFRDVNGFPYQKDGADVLYAKARGQNCELYFENEKEPLIYGYPLIHFHQKVWDLNLFRRIDWFLLVKIGCVLNRKWRKALLSNGLILRLTRSGNNKLKNYLAKHKNSESGNK
ncbi:MAG: hypothetical protein HY063_03535 [Bacteroidetes bacterium]|nr:hypothetical protein [Bacteroidota bacterium]